MSHQDAIAALVKLGVEIDPVHATLVVPPGFTQRAELADLMPLLKMHRSAILGDVCEPWTCAGCRREFHVPVPDAKEFPNCHLAECPLRPTQTRRAEMATCRSCGATIQWVETVTGKKMPLDAEPHEDGNIALLPAGAMVLTKDLAEQGKKIGSKRYRSHFATCPSADQHRKPKGA